MDFIKRGTEKQEMVENGNNNKRMDEDGKKEKYKIKKIVKRGKSQEDQAGMNC